MSRNLSLAARQSMATQQTEVVWLILLTITHDDLEYPIRLVNNYSNITSGGDIYTGYPFLIDIPGDSEDRPPTVQIQIDNVDRSIVQSIRTLTSAPTISLEVITTEDVDFVEIGPLEFELKSVEYDALVVSGTLAFEPILHQAWPSGTFTPSQFPGLF